MLRALVPSQTLFAAYPSPLRVGPRHVHATGNLDSRLDYDHRDRGGIVAK